MEKFTIKNLILHIKNIFKENKLNEFEISGEVSNYQISKGNIYFTLKDDDSSIKSIIWKSNVKNNINNGDKITAVAYIDVYDKLGTMQIIIKKYEKQGLGKIHEKYLELKAEYEKKGYFDDSRKKTIPKIIKRLGIVTSKEGAAIHDVISVLKKHGFRGEVIIKNCAVQGNNCGKEISESIEYFNKNKVDLVLITRGGGSLEDLMGFSDKNVVEAIYNCNTFTISAVGHEIDNMLSDYVADLRCPTPSAGAEYIASHNKIYWKKRLDKYNINENKNIILEKINLLETKLTNIKRDYVHPFVIINKKRKKLKLEWNKYQEIINKKINLFVNKFNQIKKIIEIYNPENKINIIDKDTNNILSSIKDIQDNKTKNIKIKFKDGTITATIMKNQED